jgi:probable F420-dependent oxidoreductase
MSSSQTSLSPYQYRLLAVLALVNFVNFADRQVFVPLLPFIRAQLGLSDAQLGSLVTWLLVVLAAASLLFGFLAGCTKIPDFSTQVLILPQRQTVLVAKQAACLDVLCGGRFRLGIGVGWNEVEYTGLNENFHNRGRRSEEQVQVMQALWAEPHVSFPGEFHKIDDAGINPRPASGRVPVWFGGHAEATFRRAAKYGDGFMPLAYPAGDEALKAFDKLRTMIRAAGRDPASVGLEVWVSPGIGKAEDWRREIGFWKKAGVTHVNAHTSYVSAHHKRIAGKSYADHLDAITRYRAAVADLL